MRVVVFPPALPIMCRHQDAEFLRPKSQIHSIKMATLTQIHSTVEGRIFCVRWCDANFSVGRFAVVVVVSYFIYPGRVKMPVESSWFFVWKPYLSKKAENIFYLFFFLPASTSVFLLKLPIPCLYHVGSRACRFSQTQLLNSEMWV